MSMPTFTADASLCNAIGSNRRVASRVQSEGYQDVVPQLPGSPFSWERANAVRNIIGSGRVICTSDCSGLGDTAGPQFCREVCAWWPY